MVSIQLAISDGLTLLQNQRKISPIHSNVLKTWPERQVKYKNTLGNFWEQTSFHGTELPDFSQYVIRQAMLK